MSKENPTREELEAKWESLTIKDDPIFGAVMEDEELCKELLRRSLEGAEVQTLDQLTSQYTINGPLASRGVRYDVYVRDEQKRTFIVECQVKNEHNILERLRYYAGSADQDVLEPGDDYAVLREYPTYTMAFCDFDPLGEGRAVYRLEMRDTAYPDQPSSDGRTMIVFNPRATDFTGAEKIRSFLDLMRGVVDTEDKFITRLLEREAIVKKDPERKAAFMKLEWKMAQREAKGKDEGKTEFATTLVHNMEAEGKGKNEIVSFMTTMLDLPQSLAEKYYDQAMAVH